MDIGLHRLENIVLDMAKLSERTVLQAVDAFGKGVDERSSIYSLSEGLRLLQDEVSELSVEIIARYQPVATDLRFIKSCMEIAYGFSRFGRYAYDISSVLSVFKDVADCDRTLVYETGQKVVDMIKSSVEAFRNRDVNLARAAQQADDAIDKVYADFVEKIVEDPKGDIRCHIAMLLPLRYLERIADHASYIAESVLYIVEGERRPRK